MTSILNKIVEHKRTEVEAAKSVRSLSELKRQLGDAPVVRSFLEAIVADPGVSLIAEVKKGSPSKGTIRAQFDPIAIAQSYQRSGACCVSVLTDEKYFQGHLDYLVQIRQAIALPLLRKDFIVDPYQVFEARVAGADAVLLIAECLSGERMIELYDLIVELGMTALVELYDPENLPKVLACKPQLVGINNRDLATFETDLNHCVRLRDSIPEGIAIVGESGIESAADVKTLAAARIDAMLVGESLMRSANIESAVAALLKK